MLKTGRLFQRSLLLCLGLAVTTLAHAQTIQIDGPVGPGTSIGVTGADEATVYAYIQPKAKVKPSPPAPAPDCKRDHASFASHQKFTLAGSAAQDLTFAAVAESSAHR